MQTSESGQCGDAVPYPTRFVTLPAFDLVGFTAVVASGGEQYDAVRGDERWGLLRAIGGTDGTIYGVASLDSACPAGRYRYTLAVRADETEARAVCPSHDLHRMRIGASEWVVFSLDHFGRQYGAYWQDDPYAMIRRLGWDFNRDLALHLDLYGPAYQSDDDAMEFLMPVAHRAEE